MRERRNRRREDAARRASPQVTADAGIGKADITLFNLCKSRRKIECKIK